jgi:hypothetical protein
MVTIHITEKKNHLLRDGQDFVNKTHRVSKKKEGLPLDRRGNGVNLPKYGFEI